MIVRHCLAFWTCTPRDDLHTSTQHGQLLFFSGGSCCCQGSGAIQAQRCQFRVGVVGNISACHADARGSIPRHGGFSFFFILFPFSLLDCARDSIPKDIASIGNDTLPEWLRGSPAK